MLAIGDNATLPIDDRLFCYDDALRILAENIKAGEIGDTVLYHQIEAKSDALLDSTCMPFRFSLEERNSMSLNDLAQKLRYNCRVLEQHKLQGIVCAARKLAVMRRELANTLLELNDYHYGVEIQIPDAIFALQEAMNLLYVNIQDDYEVDREQFCYVVSRFTSHFDKCSHHLLSLDEEIAIQRNVISMVANIDVTCIYP